MPVRRVLRYPHPALKEKARTLDPSAEAGLIAEVAADLLDTMRESPGCVGLAAPQIDHRVRMVVVDVTGHRREPPTAHGLLVLVNPEVTGRSGETVVAREGCLSLPDLTANVRRPVRATIAAMSTDGRPVTVESEAFEARALLHEIDHLDGILFLDRVASLKDDVFRRKVYK